jgi:hypothetical protein
LKNEVEKKMIGLGLNEFLRPINWEKYRSVIDKALFDIEQENEQYA